MPFERQWVYPILSLLVLAAIGWTTRNQYASCEPDGCVVINRWTGSIEFRDAEYFEEAVVEENIVLRSGPR